jgi:hypothetical protein
MIDADLIYAAGIIDGEGNVSLITQAVRDKRKTLSYIGIVQVEMSDEPTIQFLRDLFGVGYVCTYPRNPKHKQLWRWVAKSASARKVCWDLLPYLRIKQRQAELVITLPVWKQGQGAVPAEVVATKATMLAEMRSLNQTGA